MSAEPELTETRVQDEDEFFIIACDGLWDVLSSAEAVTFVRTRIKSQEAPNAGALPLTSDDLLAAARDLVNHAIEEKGSSDNVTVLSTLALKA